MNAPRLPVIAIVVIHYSNGSTDELPFTRFDDALHYCRNNISYSAGKVRRVEIRDTVGGGDFAAWDTNWDTISQWRALRRNTR